jgi:alpha-L-rhamnosidase
MRIYRTSWLCSVLLALAAFPTAAEGPGAPQNLRCEYEHNPLGIDVAQPRLSWEVNDTRRDAVQSAYQVVVAAIEMDAAAGKGTIWDSGKVASDQSIHVVYAGRDLQSGERCYWSVRTWDAAGVESPWSEPASWEMGLLDPANWQAKWITIEETRDGPAPLFGNWIWHPSESTEEVSRYFRTTFDLPADARVSSATAWGAANNEYVFSLNGKEEGGCDEWKAVESFDVAKDLVPGKNVVAIKGVHARGLAGIVFGMRIALDNGRTIEIRSGQDWLTAADAPEGWQAVDFNAKDWIRPRLVAKYGDAPWGKVADRYPSRSFYLRKAFTTQHAAITRARVYVSALGAYNLLLNGQRIGRDELTPGWTHFRKHIQYQTYDVTASLRGGDNAIGLQLGNGWWGGSMAGAWKDGNLRAIAQLEIVYDDGTRQVVATDPTWKGHTSPILKDSIYHGETYDASLELSGWNKPGFDDAHWLPAQIWDKPQGQLVAQVGPPIRITEELPAVAVTEPQPGVYVFDFGQNAAGRARLKVEGPKGTRVQIRHGEILRPDGNVYTDNLQGAKCTDVYILKGEGMEVWEPAFTYRGFRYAELTGYPGVPDKEALLMRVMHADLPPTGTFSCSEDIVNRVQKNILWGMRSNFYSVPTDCPQRDERLGWTGDMQLFMATAGWNMDVAGFTTKWLRDVVDSRTDDGGIPDVAPALNAGPGAPGWGDVVVVAPWNLYTYYGDTRAVETNYAAMKDWVDYMRKRAKDGLYQDARYGDWVPVEPSPREPLAGAYQYLSTKRLAEMADAIGRPSDAADLRAQAASIAEAFNSHYFNADTAQYEGGTQTANIVPLWFEITPEDKRAAVIDNIANNIVARGNHLSTGFIGTAYLMPTLSAFGRDDLAGILATQRTYPSWGYTVDAGATTIWERWNSDKYEELNSGMNSFNHFAFGTVGQWYYEYLVGIRALAPGFKRILIEPHPSGIEAAEATYHSMYGPIHCAWTQANGFALQVTIPANATALVKLPVPCQNGLSATPDTAFSIGAGTYTFTSAQKK